MFGVRDRFGFARARRRREASAAATAGIAKNLRRPRLDTMRFYQRKRMWQALQAARLELAVRKAAPSVFLYTLLAAAAGVAITVGVKWLLL